MKLVKWLRSRLDPVTIGTRVTITKGRYRGCSGVVKTYYRWRSYHININSGRGTRNYFRHAFTLRVE